MTTSRHVCTLHVITLRGTMHACRRSVLDKTTASSLQHPSCYKETKKGKGTNQSKSMTPLPNSRDRSNKSTAPTATTEAPGKPPGARNATWPPAAAANPGGTQTTQQHPRYSTPALPRTGRYMPWSTALHTPMRISLKTALMYPLESSRFCLCTIAACGCKRRSHGG